MSNIVITIGKEMVPSYEGTETVAAQFWFREADAAGKDLRELYDAFDNALAWLKSEKIRFKKFGKFSFIIFLRERDAMRLKLWFS